MDNLVGRLKSLDAYPKVNEDFFTRTLSGGLITIVSSIIMACLFISELRLFLTVNTVHELAVDTSRGEQLEIFVDITFPGMPCEWISLDAMDISGEMHLDVDHEVYKKRLTASGEAINEGERHNIGLTTADDPLVSQHGKHMGNGTYCGSCYGAEDVEGECCNTCDEVRRRYRKRGWAFTDPQQIEQCAKEGYMTKLREQEGEGCHMWGTLQVNKVAGNFHFAPGKSFQQGNMHVHDLVPFQNLTFDVSHRIHQLRFGKPYPGMHNPLDGVTVDQHSHHMDNILGQPGMYQYFLKVVPTIYTTSRNHSTYSNQYSVTEHFRAADVVSNTNLPGVFFFYDLSPIKVRIAEERSSFIHFLTSACAIVGGIFTVAGIVDAFVYHGQQAMKKKIDLGKQG